MDGKVRYASASCLAESPAGGKDQLLGNVALSHGACENGLDLSRRFLRKCGGQIGATDLLLPHQGPDRAGDPAEQVGGLDRIEIAGGTQYSDRQRTHRGLVVSRSRALARSSRRCIRNQRRSCRTLFGFPCASACIIIPALAIRSKRLTSCAALPDSCTE